MDERTSNEQTPADCREASVMKQAGQVSIFLFVIFVISLLSFGKAPLNKITGTNSSSVNFNLISCLGVGFGVFAFFFLLVRFKTILRIETATKVLGLIGGFGLITHTILAIFLPLSYQLGAGFGSARPTGSAGFQPMAQSGAEEWVIDGKTYRISSTYYLRLSEGFQFTIGYPHQFNQGLDNMNKERALKIVFPLMKHAYRNNLHERASVTKLGQGKLTPSRIGVVLFDKQGGKASGFKVALSLDQIKKRISQAPPAGSATPSDPSVESP